MSCLDAEAESNSFLQKILSSCVNGYQKSTSDMFDRSLLRIILLVKLHAVGGTLLVGNVGVLYAQVERSPLAMSESGFSVGGGPASVPGAESAECPDFRAD